MKASDKIYQILSQRISTAYMFSGGSIMGLIDKFKYNKIKYYIPTSEASAGFCSIGHNKSLNRLDSVIITTSGPGLTNILTPLADAYCDRVPLMVISGDVSTEMMGKNSFQEAPSIDLTKPITNWNHTLNKSDNIDEIFNHAFNLTKENKQVHINIPKDVLFNTYDESINKSNNQNQIELDNNLIELDNNLIRSVADIINNSNKPVLYIGRGCIESANELKVLAFKSTIPVTTTLHGVGIIEETSYLSLKMVGMHGSVRANMAIQESDCIICIGARFDDRTVGNIKYYAPNAKHIIHINNNHSDFNKVLNHTINIYGDSKYIINQLINHIKPRYNEEWLKYLDIYNINFNYDDSTLKQQYIIKQIDFKLNTLNLKHKTIFTTGVGNHQMYVAQLITHLFPNRLITSGSLGTMGAGNSMAIGAKIANPDKIVISIDGDQSFNMLNDLKMIQNYKIPIKIVIMNDSKQSMVNVWEKLFFDNVIATESKNPDYELLAKSYQIKAITIDKTMDSNTVDQLIEQFIQYDISEPILLNCIIDSDFCFPLVPPGNALNDMITYENFHEKKINSNTAPS